MFVVNSRSIGIMNASMFWYTCIYTIYNLYKDKEVVYNIVKDRPTKLVYLGAIIFFMSLIFLFLIFKFLLHSYVTLDNTLLSIHQLGTLPATWTSAEYHFTLKGEVKKISLQNIINFSYTKRIPSNMKVLKLFFSCPFIFK
jgi:hypothetical protein